MNYYIQGDAAKAEQIKAAFERLGIDVLDFGFADKTVVYCSIGGCVQYLPYSINLMNILYSHPDYKELELPIEPKFKVGDEIKTGNTIETIAEVGHATRSYYCESGRTIYFENQDLWHLTPKPHYDISNFKPFDKVLVRDCDTNGTWKIELFSHRSKDGWFICVGSCYCQCIPFEGNEHLLGTTDMPSEEYINW